MFQVLYIRKSACKRDNKNKDCKFVTEVVFFCTSKYTIFTGAVLLGHNFVHVVLFLVAHRDAYLRA